MPQTMMAVQRPVPSPAQIRAYLTANGWHKGWDIPNAGEMFVYKELSDDGKELTVFLPMHDLYDDYPYGVAALVESVAFTEGRPMDAVWADLRATATPSAPITPAPAPSPEPAPTDPVTP